MSLDAFVWAVKDAPKANVEEHGVLSVMADEVTESGLGCLLATKTIAKRAIMSDKTVQRRLDDLLRRGLIGYGDQTLARYIRADQRPIVYNLLIPYTAFGSIKRVNEARVAKGLPPLTAEPCPTPAPVACGCPDDAGAPHARKPEQCPQVVRAGCGCPPELGAPHRPEQPEAPMKKRRADLRCSKHKGEFAHTCSICVGPTEDQVSDPEQDDQTTSHPVNSDGGTTSPVVDGGTTSPAGLVNADGGTSSSPRGVRKSPDPKELDPEGLDPNKTPPTSASTEVATSDVDEAVTGGEKISSEEGPQDTPDDLTDAEKGHLTEALDAALSRRHADPRWYRKAVIEGMQAAIQDGHSVAAVAAGIRLMAADPASKYPGRLSHWLSLNQTPSGDDPPPEEPKRVVGPLDQRCRKHQGELANNCSGCAGEQLAQDEPPHAHPAARDHDPDRWLRRVQQRRPAATVS
jgi:hypothetical protein